MELIISRYLKSEKFIIVHSFLDGVIRKGACCVLFYKNIDAIVNGVIIGGRIRSNYERTNY